MTSAESTPVASDAPIRRAAAIQSNGSLIRSDG
jgi:hypothetical protein